MKQQQHKQARNTPTQFRSTTEIDARSIEPPKLDAILLDSIGAAREAIVPARTVTGPNGEALPKEYLDALAFMEQELEIMIHPASPADRSAEHLIKLGVNGTNQFVPRDMPVKVKRKYVEVLAKARPIGINTREYLDAEGGRAIKIERSVMLQYPFSVLFDPAGANGAAWLRGVMHSE